MTQAHTSPDLVRTRAADRADPVSAWIRRAATRARAHSHELLILIGTLAFVAVAGVLGVLALAR